jgi:hypothetical protein
MTDLVFRTGDFLHSAGWGVVRILLFQCPVALFVYLGFTRMTNVHETIVVGSVCIVLACLSWVAGWALRYILART